MHSVIGYCPPTERALSQTPFLYQAAPVFVKEIPGNSKQARKEAMPPGACLCPPKSSIPVEVNNADAPLWTLFWGGQGSAVCCLGLKNKGAAKEIAEIANAWRAYRMA
jgi:hypothetical protein